MCLYFMNQFTLNLNLERKRSLLGKQPNVHFIMKIEFVFLNEEKEIDIRNCTNDTRISTKNTHGYKLNIYANINSELYFLTKQ